MKILKNGFTLVIVQNETGTISVTAHYIVASDDLKENRAMPVPITSEQTQLIKQFGLAVIAPALRAKEGL